MNGTRVVFSPFFPPLFLLLLFVLVASNIWWTSVARVYTLSCTRQRFTYRYVPAIVAITSPLMALHNVICRPAPFLSDLFAPIVIPLLPSLFSLSLFFSSSLSLSPDAWFSIPSFPTARGEIECLRLNVFRSIFGISRWKVKF